MSLLTLLMNLMCPCLIKVSDSFKKKCTDPKLLAVIDNKEMQLLKAAVCQCVPVELSFSITTML